MLRHYDLALQTQLETDASRYVLSSILSQLFRVSANSKWHLVAFFLQKLNLVEFRYDTHDKELLAIVRAMDH